MISTRMMRMRTSGARVAQCLQCIDTLYVKHMHDNTIYKRAPRPLRRRC
jgi:hypothetical protein